MANASYVQTSFAGGKWSQAAQGQSARPDYRTAMNVCLNGMPTETAAWVRRPGFRQAGFTRGGAAGRQIRFDFEENQPYNMEFTDGHLRFWNGPHIVTTNDDQVISGISAATPAVVTTALTHNWSTGDQVVFKRLGATAVLLQHRAFVITRLSGTTFSLADAITGASIVGTTLTAAAGVVARILDLATAYSGGVWSTLRSVQTERQAVLLNGTQPQVLTLATDPGPSLFAGFSLAASNFLDGPYLDPFPNSLVTPSAAVGNLTLTFSFAAYSATVSYSINDYVTSGGINYKSLSSANLANTPASSPTFWAVVSGGDPVSPSGFVAADIGRHIRLYSEPALWAAATTYSAKDVVAYNELYWESIVGSNTGNPPGLDVTKWQLRTGSSYALWSWGRITAIAGSGIIAGNLAGSTNIGDMTGGGGLAAVFDGTTTKSGTAGAYGTPATVAGQRYVGKNYSGASAQTIAQATVYPATDWGFGVTPGAGGTAVGVTVTLNLRAKQTLPASAADGTLLGTTGAFPNQFTPMTINSIDQATAWNYIWIEIIATKPPSGVFPAIAQVVLFAPNVVNGSVVTLQLAGPALLYTSAIRVWRAGAFSGSTSWPKCGTYVDGRLWLSGAIPNRVDGSKSNDIFNFAPTELDGTVTDASAIDYTFNLPDVNPVFWMEPDEQGVICGTQAGEVLIDSGGGGGPIKPTAIRARRRTAVKCYNALPARCDHTLVFIQKNARRVMEYFADIYSGKFQAPNLSYLAKDLTASGLRELAFQQDLVPVVWVRTGDGSLIGMAYKRDSNISAQAPVLMGWHQHSHGGGRTFTSIVVGPSENGDLETLSAVTTDGTYYYVELMADVFEETDALADAAHVDAHIVPSYYSASNDGLSLNLYGLYGLNGKTVSVWAGGLDCGDVTVANGTAAVVFGDGVAAGTGGGLFTQAHVASFGEQACPIRVGYTYTSRGQTLRPASAEVTGARTGPGFAKERRTHRMGVQMVQTRGLSIGTEFGKLKACRFTLADLRTKLSALQPFNGIYKDMSNDPYSLDSMLAWEITRPYPAIVTAAGAFLDTQDQ
jgi:hypothetical protein